MTEVEWQSCNNTSPMLYHLDPTGRSSDRRARLFLLNCCGRVWPVLKPWVRKAVEHILQTAERFAEGQATEDELRAAVEAGPATDWNATSPFVKAASLRDLAVLAMYTTHNLAEIIAGAAAYPADSEEDPAWLAAYLAERSAQANILRDIFGNPFRRAVIDPAWLAWNDGMIPGIA